jgi:hypothetical protein
MSILRFLLCLLLLGAAAPSFSNTSPSTEAAIVSCNLPAPASVWITGTTTTSIAVAWTPVAGAASYLVKATNASSGITEYTGTVPGTSDNCIGLTSGTEFNITVQAVDASGCVSPNKGQAKGSTDFIIIDDFIAQITPNTALPCNVTVTPASSDQGEPIAIRYVRQGQVAYEHFRVAYGPPPGGGQSLMKVIHPNEDNYSGWLFGNGLVAPPVGGNSVTTQRIYAYKPGTVITPGPGLPPPADLVIQVQNVSSGSQFGCTLCIISQPAGNPYSLWRCTGNCLPGAGGGGGGERDSELPQGDMATQVSPNPFDDKVQVRFAPIAGETGGQLRLLDANGREISNLPLSKDETTATFYTDGLPKGLYLIRLETADKVETHKVIKAN